MARQRSCKKLDKRLIELNFEDDPSLARLFTSNDPVNIMLNIEDLFGGTVKPSECILFLDEIQDIKGLFKKLRWFYEKMPELPVIATRSLLQVGLDNEKRSMPVGRVSYMYLEPFSFEEYLRAIGKDSLVELVNRYTFGTKIPEVTHNTLISLFKEYTFVGGMPAALREWISSPSLEELGNVHRDLIRSYREDFGVYSGRLASQRLDEVMVKIPRMLGNKFKYSEVNKKVRSEAIRNALTLLCNARVCSRVLATAANGIPLDAEVKETYFKVLFVDVGLCSSLLKLSYSQLQSTDELDLINSGGIAEQVVGQLLRTLNPPFEEPENYYWVREKKSSQAELDYVLQHRTSVVPIEVKAGPQGQLKSLHVFMELKNGKKAVRIYMGHPESKKIHIAGYHEEKVSYQLYSLPFYLVEQVHRLLDS